MKKIGIISDTHGLLRPEILGILKGCDCIIHAGDVNKPEILDTLRMMGSIYVVRGNNDKDWAEGMAKTLHFTIEGVKFFMTHNKKDVDWDLKDTQVVIFGHTHKYFEKMIDNRLWLNPGKRLRQNFCNQLPQVFLYFQGILQLHPIPSGLSRKGCPHQSALCRLLCWLR